MSITEAIELLRSRHHAVGDSYVQEGGGVVRDGHRIRVDGSELTHAEVIALAIRAKAEPAN